MLRLKKELKPYYHGPNNYLKSTAAVDLMAVQKFSSDSSPNNLKKGHGMNQFNKYFIC